MTAHMPKIEVVGDKNLYFTCIRCPAKRRVKLKSSVIFTNNLMQYSNTDYASDTGWKVKTPDGWVPVEGCTV